VGNGQDAFKNSLKTKFLQAYEVLQGLTNAKNAPDHAASA
jgi:hypothetical protein